MLVASIFSFFNNVFKRFLFQCFKVITGQDPVVIGYILEGKNPKTYQLYGMANGLHLGHMTPHNITDGTTSQITV